MSHVAAILNERGASLPVAEETLRIDLTHPAALAVLLQREAGIPLPRIVNVRLGEVLDPDTHIIFDPLNQTTVDLHLRFRLTSTTGQLETIDRKRTIPRKPNNNTSKGAAGAIAAPADIAKLLLRDEMNIEQAERMLDIAIGHGDSHTRGFALMRDFAAGAGLSRPLLHALIDASPEVRRTIWLLHTSDQLPLETYLVDISADLAWAQLIRRTYFRSDVATRGSWPLTWLAADHEEDRQVVAALLAAGGSAHPNAVAAATGLPVDQAKQTASVPALSFQRNVSPKVSHPPAVLKNEWRGARPVSDQRLMLAPCPHDCEGFVDIPLWTPETDRPAEAARSVGTHQMAA